MRDHDRGGYGSCDGAILALNIPQHDYYLYADQADEDEISRSSSAPPVEELNEDYTLDEIRYSPDIRKRSRKLNLNTITSSSANGRCVRTRSKSYTEYRQGDPAYSSTAIRTRCS